MIIGFKHQAVFHSFYQICIYRTITFNTDMLIQKENKRWIQLNKQSIKKYCVKKYWIVFKKIKACMFVRPDLPFAFFLLASCQNTGEGICRKNGDLCHHNTGRRKKARGERGKRRIYFSPAWDYWNCTQFICYCFCVHLHYTLMTFLNIDRTAHSAKTGDGKNDF